MSSAATADVAALYARYPYPSPVVGKSLVYDIANLFLLLCGGDDLAGKTVLDAGCGTGQRVLGFARRFPKASFLAVDLAEPALEVARRLAERHAIRNAAFRRGDLLSLDLDQRFDVIVSTGVVHHLEDPRRGLENLCRHLADDGVICIWSYHPFGEFDRLVRRELLQALWGGDRGDLALGERIMDELGLRLPPAQYGAGAMQAEAARSEQSMNADAFMHPIVNAYRFDEAMAMFRSCEVDWAAVNGINTPGGTRLIDLAAVEEVAREFCLKDAELLPSEALLARYRALPVADRLRVIELALKPTGYTILAGRGDSLRMLGGRIAGNAMRKAELPDPYPRMLRV